MKESRILIVGSNGQLGKALQVRYPSAKPVDREQLDITDWNALREYDWSSVDTIINAAVYANVDGAETSEGRELAWQVNSTAVGYLSRIATEHDLTLVHVSTDYVFDGTKSPHQEDEHLAPLGVYAQSKAAGDIAAAITPKHYIFRTSWLIGDGPNFVRTMMGLAAKNVSPTVVSDQVGRLTFTQTLVDGIDFVLSAVDSPPGVYNLSNDGEPASWADITRTIFKEMGREDLKVTDTSTAEYFKSKPTSAPRPLQSTLDLSKIKALGVPLVDWRTELHKYIKHEQSKEA